MCLPRSKGDLSSSNAHIQQGALQLQWLIPFLTDFRIDTESSSFCLNPNSDANYSIMLSRLLNSFYQYALNPPNYRLPLLLPALRLQPLQGINSVFALLFKALDSLTHLFRPFIATAVTPETLACVPKRLCTLLMFFLYEHNPDRDHCLRPILSRARIVKYPTLSKRPHQLVNMNNPTEVNMVQPKALDSRDSITAFGSINPWDKE
ncbi:hypothetical protein EDC96DRAFT_594765 [Choanephora cucurbitarum]|nr:hypothetical protein EDC96DRAFT_594765 [Choanephora cucurbitarum]